MGAKCAQDTSLHRGNTKPCAAPLAGLKPPQRRALGNRSGQLFPLLLQEGDSLAVKLAQLLNGCSVDELANELFILLGFELLDNELKASGGVVGDAIVSLEGLQLLIDVVRYRQVDALLIGWHISHLLCH